MKRALAVGVLAFTAAGAFAADYPVKAIRIVSPFPPGGSVDLVARILGADLGKVLGQQIIVDNKPGAGGMLGANELVSAKPDGYTLSQLPHGVFRIPHMQKTQFDTLKDFTWIACLTGYTFGLVVPADSPIKSIADHLAHKEKDLLSV